MKVLALTALLVATTTMGGVPATSSGVASVKGTLHSAPLMTKSAILPKCFPDCDGD